MSRRRSDHTAVGLALAVDRLFHRHPEFFLRRIEEFKGEAPAVMEADRNAYRAEQAALKALRDEYEALRSGTGTRHLTDPNRRPGEGWRWVSGDYQLYDPSWSLPSVQVRGWLPADVYVRHERPAYREWPGPNPSAATVFVLLAALHDNCLPHAARSILDPRTADLRAVFKSKDDGLKMLGLARFSCTLIKWDWGLIATFKTYLRFAKAELEAGRSKAGEARQGSPQTEKARTVPMSLAELARRYMDDQEARPDKVKPILKRLGLRQVAKGKNKWTVCLDNVSDATTRERLTRSTFP